MTGVGGEAVREEMRPKERERRKNDGGTEGCPRRLGVGRDLGAVYTSPTFLWAHLRPRLCVCVSMSTCMSTCVSSQTGGKTYTGTQINRDTLCSGWVSYSSDKR